MKFTDISNQTINEWKNEALQKKKEREGLKDMSSLEREKEFLDKLKFTADSFVQQIRDAAIQELHDCSLKGYLRKKFIFQDFKEKFGPVKVSTLVKGFHIGGEWDASIFKKINYSQTPFQTAVEQLAEIGVILRDVSDITKSTGFWVEVSFACEEN